MHVMCEVCTVTDSTRGMWNAVSCVRPVSCVLHLRSHVTEEEDTCKSCDATTKSFD